MKVKFISALALITAVVVAGFWAKAIWSDQIISEVINSAEITAGQQPYCIQVNEGNDYKEAQVLSDLSGNKMRGAGHGNYHAILVVGDVFKPKLFNWSYNKKSFLNDVYGSPAIYCSPHKHFATTLTNVSRPESQMLDFVYSGMRFSLPTAAKPFTNGVNHPGVNFLDLYGEITPDSQNLIEVNFELTGRMQAWIYRENPSHIVEADGEIYGLKKQNSWYFDPSKEKREKRKDRRSIQYFVESDSKVISTLIDCADAVEGECNHVFQSDGWTYTFRYKSIYLADWKQLEGRVVKLTHSYIIARARNN